MIKNKPEAFIVANNLPPLNDGVGHYSYNLYNYLKTNGINVKIVTNGRNTQNIYFGNSDIIELGLDSWNWSGCSSFYNTIQKKKPKWLLIQYEPYSFSSNGFPFIFTIYLILIRIGGTKLQITFHEISVRFLDNGFKSFFRAFLQRGIAYTLCFISANILTSNRYYASLLCPFKSSVISIPSNFEQYISNTSKAKVRRDNKVIITSTANRSHDYFFKVISLLSKSSPFEFVVNITGRAENSDLQRINNLTHKYLLKNIVNCKVNLDELEYCDKLINTDIFLHLENVSVKGAGGVSSKSGVVATAMAYGLPIITTFGDMTDIGIFKNNENLIFVPHDNPVIVADKIQSLINNSIVKKILSDEAKSTYQNCMQWSNSINYYLDILS